ncbi:MAG TPA: YdcF family protein [Acetobacteraceae bacterium]|jgi:uncharacterized SAM-binding protein YcdF (DUF218 family)
MTRRGLTLRLAGWTLFALVVAWDMGLVWFIQFAARPVPPPPEADGIVALTGGAERVETALRLLQAHRAAWLLLSGIGIGVDLAVLAHRAQVEPAPLAARVTLGRQATSTRGNALETAAWARDHDIHTLIVVTAYYHMPRALTELRRALPGVALYPEPVLRPQSGFLGPLVTLRLTAEEYTKYLMALIGVTTLLPGREQVPPHEAHRG